MTVGEGGDGRSRHEFPDAPFPARPPHWSGRVRSGFRRLPGKPWIGLGLVVVLVLAAVFVVHGRQQQPRRHPRHPRPTLSPLAAATRGRYVALGDSYSSGVGALDYAKATNGLPDSCDRSAHAYPQLLAKRFRFADGWQFWACSGATTGDLLRADGSRPAQISHITSDTSLVTVGIGGNDVGFTQVLTVCVVEPPGGHRCQDQEPAVRRRVEALRRHLASVLDQIHHAAPRARTLVVGYPRLFPATPRHSVSGIDVGDQRWLNRMATLLDNTSRGVARSAERKLAHAGRASVEYVDTGAAFARHELGSASPYINTLRIDFAHLRADPASFHPTASGQSRLERAVAGQLRRGPRHPLYR